MFAQHKLCGLRSYTVHDIRLALYTYMHQARRAALTSCTSPRPHPMMAATHPCGTHTATHAITHSALHACCSSPKLMHGAPYHAVYAKQAGVTYPLYTHSHISTVARSSPIMLSILLFSGCCGSCRSSDGSCRVSHRGCQILHHQRAHTAGLCQLQRTVTGSRTTTPQEHIASLPEMCS